MSTDITRVRSRSLKDIEHSKKQLADLQSLISPEVLLKQVRNFLDNTKVASSNQTFIESEARVASSEYVRNWVDSLLRARSHYTPSNPIQLDDTWLLPEIDYSKYSNGVTILDSQPNTWSEAFQLQMKNYIALDAAGLERIRDTFIAALKERIKRSGGSYEVFRDTATLPIIIMEVDGHLCIKSI
ncbi:MAG: hypothetical protein P1P90_04455 [Patescibacteria group bacterium]|nr:hypothetical protein [Patescibacteria group bacterium]